MDERKQRQVERYLKGARRLEKKDEAQARKKARLQDPGAPMGDPGRGRRREPLDEDAWEVEARLAKPRPSRRSRGARKGPRPLGTSVSAGHGDPAPDDPAAPVARVAWLGPGRARVFLDGESVEAHVGRSLAARLRVGDRVQLAGEEEAWRIRGVLPRTSELTRADPQNPELSRVVAVNVDLGLIVLTPHGDRLPYGIAERMRVGLLAAGIEPRILLHQVDRLDAARRALAREELEHLEPDGPLETSVVSGEGLEALRALVAGRTVVLLGHSGVGKSSLTNALVPDADLPVGAVRERDGRGRHTTTSASLWPLPGEGFLVDTPGVRLFGAGPRDPRELASLLPELHDLALRCPRGCTHLEDEACSVALAARDDTRVARALELLRRLAREGEQDA